MVRKETIYILGGWSGSLILAFLLLVTEVSLHFIGGDWGAFLFVTFHFVLLPVMSVIVLLITGFKIYKMQERMQKIMTLMSISIPLGILYISVTGNTFLMEVLQIDFNK